MRKYQPIENYGVIGDLNTAALVGLDGSIDFMCFPHFDSPTIFAAILDVGKGGYFQIYAPQGEVQHRQMYLPDTNILLTRHLSDEGVGEIIDFMPVEEVCTSNVLVRRVRNARGQTHYQMECCPRFNYGRSGHKIIRKSDYEVIFVSQNHDGLVLRLSSTLPIEIRDDDAFAAFTLKEGENADFMLEQYDENHPERGELIAYVNRTFKETVNFWKNWISRSQYQGRWQEMVNRSALVLKLLTSHRYGSIVAAPTFALPEEIGGGKNWDYRYNWIRDTAFTLYALIRLGYTKEAGSFIHWLQERCADIRVPGELGLMYGLDGSKELVESVLDHFEGYRKSGPVRIGNAAYEQTQMDIYGELMDSIYLYNKYGEMISHDFWNDLVLQIDWLCDNWQEPDHGIWEVREGKRAFLYSRLMCWVAVDRAVRLANKRSFPTPAKWMVTRDTIYDSIFNDYWDDNLQTFVQFKGSQRVDASTLLMPLVRFISPHDPRWLSTLACIEKELVSDSLVYRYRTEAGEARGLHADEGTFSLCSFWYVECLSRSGYLEKARFFFEKMMSYANHLGLYSEQLGFRGEHLGNFPQAFTHLGLISAAYNLNQQLNDRRNTEHQ